MFNFIRAVVFITATLLLVGGCGPADSGGPGGPGSPNDPDPHPYGGEFIGWGSGYVHTMDLTRNGPWQKKISVSTGYDTPAVHLAANEIYVAGLSGEGPMVVTVYDIDTFGTKRAFTWPETEDLWRVGQLAVSPGGRYVAATLAGTGDAFLEVIEVDESTTPASTTIHFTSAQGLVHSNLLWTDANELVFSTVSEGAWELGEYAAIIAVPLEVFLEEGEFGAFVIRTFDQATWGSDGVERIALSADGTQIAYSLNGDIWTLELTGGAEPRQLTTGPSENRGPVLSPDGSYVAFVTGGRYGLSDTLIVPNDGGPYLVDRSDHSLTEAYVVHERNLVEVLLAWRP